VGTYRDARFNIHGFLLSGGNYTTLDPPGSSYTQASGINNLGQIVGSYTDAKGVDHGFLFSGGSYTTLDVPFVPNSQTAATGINNLSQIVGAWEGGRVGFTFSGGRYTAFSVPGYATVPAGINDAGQIAGIYYTGFVSGPSRGFLLSGGKYTTLDVPGAVHFYGGGINNLGQIVFGYDGYGLVVSGDTYTSFDVPGADFTAAYGIDDSGMIVYRDVGGTTHGFLATAAPAPEPSTFLLLTIGTLGLIGYAWRRRGLAAA
jgi:probable HAF family extracellular repeat protein